MTGPEHSAEAAQTPALSDDHPAGPNIETSQAAGPP